MSRDVSFSNGCLINCVFNPCIGAQKSKVNISSLPYWPSMQLLYIKTKPADATQAGHLRFTLVAPLPPPLHRKFRKSVQPIKIINCNENTQAIHVYQHPVNSRIDGFLILVDIRHVSRRPARISKLIQQKSVRYLHGNQVNANLKLAPTPLQVTMLMFVMCETIL